jgi:hypothetical protein
MTLVEELREAHEIWNEDYELYGRAADHIEALEAALREIVDEPIPEQASLWVAAFNRVRDIARAALTPAS